MQQSGERTASVSTSVTSFVFLAGVVSGLVIVIAFIIVCKLCQHRSKAFPRSGRGDSRRSERLSHRAQWSLRRFETITSDTLTDPSSFTQDEVPLTPRRHDDLCRSLDMDGPTETTPLHADFDRDGACAHSDGGDWKGSQFETREESATSSRTATHKSTGAVPYQLSTGSWGSGCRRVSFQLDNMPRSSSSGDFKGRRYIEGDFHHLKHSKIGLSPLLPRQYSMGGPGSPIPSRMFLDQTHIRCSSLDETAGRGGLNIQRSPGRSVSTSPALSKTFQGEDAQALEILFQQNKQQRQQKLLSQVAAALASSSAANPSPTAASSVSTQSSSACHQKHQQDGDSHSPQLLGLLGQGLDLPQTLRPPSSPGLQTLSVDRESACFRLPPRVPSAEQFQQISLDSLEVSSTCNKSGGRGSARNSPSPSSALLQGLRDSGSLNKGHAANLSPSPTFKPFLQHDFNPVRKNIPLRRSPLATLSMSASDGDGGNNGVLLSCRDSPPSPFRPIQDNTTGSSPSPPYRPVRTQVAVEVHQLHHGNNKHASMTNTHVADGNSVESSTNSGNSSEEQHNQLARRLERARSYVIESSSSCSSFQAFPSCLSSSAQQSKPVSPKPYQHGHQNRQRCWNTPQATQLSAHEPSFARSNEGTRVSRVDAFKDYDTLKITEFSREFIVAADCDPSPDSEQFGKRSGKSRSLIRYNDTGSLEKLNDDDQEMGFFGSDPQISPTGDAGPSDQVKQPNFEPPAPPCPRHQHRFYGFPNPHGNEGRSAGREEIIAACGRTTRRNRALWRLRATLEEEEECSDTLRMEDMTTSPDDDSADCEDNEVHVTTETPNTTSFESNNAHSDPCQSDHHDSGIQFETCCRVAVFPAEQDQRADDRNYEINNDPEDGQSSQEQGGGSSGGSGASPGGPGYLGNTLRPGYENRRLIYRHGVAPKGLTYYGNNRPSSSKEENSFDSVETDFDGEREGEVSDTSRPEVTSTSFESSTTTDNTDSTTESQASKLRQMKADSGYKSLETQRQTSREKPDTVAVVGTDGKIMKRGSRANSEDIVDGLAARRDSRGVAASSCFHPLVLNKGGNHAHKDKSPHSAHKPVHAENGVDLKTLKDENVSSFQRVSTSPLVFASTSASPQWRIERRSERTASKKRREFSRDRRSVQVVYESIHEPDAEGEVTPSSSSVTPSTYSSFQSQTHSSPNPHSNDDSFEEENVIPSKRSMFARFFKGPGHSHRAHYLSRDYSIDEKTNSIFNEFVRQDIDSHSPLLLSKTRGSGGCGRLGNGGGGGGGRLGNRRSPRRNPQHKLQRKHTDPGYFQKGESDNGKVGLEFRGYVAGSSLRTRDRLPRSGRSEGSVGSTRRPSPQDSIEERDDDEVDDIDEAVAMAEKAGRVDCSSVLSVGLETPFIKSSSPSSPAQLQSKMQAVSLQDIRVTRSLPEGDKPDMDSVI
ncbi:hypothetical protein PoB_000790100 [Plakobranchus ocellatus]|uniref:Uncharacterized protein n=1 Tax=Plakobranchus ocellatus TaxID=259542 RepID=A0AAV3Y2G9_9GAST|nr:hypothetical protein PoB_000790100 [Plakobranchus ocellatus]